jgi:hypothetical protein
MPRRQTVMKLPRTTLASLVANDGLGLNVLSVILPA